jgi:RNA polymerase sigma-70 factor (ECF subfamily)
LTPDQRQVVILKFLEGWSNAEVAETLNKPVGAVKSLQHRALGALRRILLE